MKVGTILILAGVALALTGAVINLRANRHEEPEPPRAPAVAPSAPKPVPEPGPEVTEVPEVPSERPEAKPMPEAQPSQKSQPTHKAAQSDDSKQKGNQFESYAADLMKANGIRLLQWNQGQTSAGGAYAEDSKNPDFFVEQTRDPKPVTYWVECKWRRSLTARGFSLKQYQYDRYRDIQKQSRRRIFILLGVGGEPSAPAEVFIIPLSDLPAEGLTPEGLEQYRRRNPRSEFVPWINYYFREFVFKK